MSDRSYAQSLQDDEDHRLALCGLSFDARAEDELEDFYSRHSDFIFAPGSHVSGNVCPPYMVRAKGGGPLAMHKPAATFFASGHPQAQPPQTRSGGRYGRSSVTPERMPAATPLSTA